MVRAVQQVQRWSALHLPVSQRGYELAAFQQTTRRQLTESPHTFAGQHPAYIETQLKEFNKRTRTNDNAIMHSIASKLTELEARAVSVYIGGLQ